MENSGGYSGPYQGPPNNKKLQQTQAQVDEVVGIMKINIEKVLERDQKLNELAEHAVVQLDTVQEMDSSSSSSSSCMRKIQNNSFNIFSTILETQQLIIFNLGRNKPQVVGIMRTNVAKVLERDEKLSELDQRADTLQMGASQFEQHAARLKRKFWWQNLKMMIIIGVTCTSLLIIFLIWIFSSGDSSNGNKVAETPAVTPKPA